MDAIPDGADRLVVVFSDIEMGPGGVLDDFPHSSWLADLMRRYSQPPYHRLAVDIVFNGDTFDLLKTSVDDTYPRHVTAPVALAKLERIRAVHQPFFDGVRDFLTTAEAPRRVHFIIGNHDAELAFPEVQRAITAAIDAQGVWFPGFRVDIGDVRIEHGNQQDSLFQVDEYQPLTTFKGERILDLPWGTIAILDVMMPLQKVLYPLDRVKPRPRVFQLLPEFQELLSNAFWKYWTRDFLYDLFSSTDPTRKVSWTMLKEVMYRFTTFDPDIAVGQGYKRLLLEDDRFRLVVLGHYHRPSWRSWGDRKLLELGCVRDEFMMDRQGVVESQLPKVYAEVFLKDRRALRSELVEVHGPPARPGHMPAAITDLRPRLQELLGSDKEVAAARQAQEAQLVKEARNGSARREPGGR